MNQEIAKEKLRGKSEKREDWMLKSSFSLLIVIFSLFLVTCFNPTGAEDQGPTGTITISLGVGGTARWSGTKPTSWIPSLTHVLELKNGASIIETATINPGQTLFASWTVPYGNYDIEVKGWLNGYLFSEATQPVTVPLGRPKHPCANNNAKAE